MPPHSTEGDGETVAVLDISDLGSLSSFKAIAGVALPAVVLNAAPPITIAIQTALLGQYGSTRALAAFAAVGTCVGFVCRVFNFLVDGVSSKVGRCVGQQSWRDLSTNVRLSLRWSAVLGAAAVPLLLVIRVPMCRWLLSLSAELQQEAAAYWVLRSFIVPLQLFNMAAAGILQGFGRVRINAALTSTAAVLEMLGSAAVLRVQYQQRQQQEEEQGSSLVAMGCVTALSSLLLAIASLACVVLLPPPGAGNQAILWGWRDMLGLGASRNSGGGGSGSTSSTTGASKASSDRSRQLDPAGDPASEDLTQPLLPSQERELEGVEDRQGLEGQIQQQSGAAGTAGRVFDATTREFFRDGSAMFIRSCVLQLTFFLALAAAARLPTTAELAAHGIISQLWMVISYAVDGFAAAGIVLGSRLYGFARNPERRPEAKRHMRRLIHRVLLAGLVSGVAAGSAFQLHRDHIISFFSADPAVAAVLLHGSWLVLAACQPLNALLFVYDGLMYATQNFCFVRDYMVAGFLLIFCPALALELCAFPSLSAIWLAKAALNVWRLAGAAYLIHWMFLPHFGDKRGPEAVGDATQDQQDGLLDP